VRLLRYYANYRATDNWWNRYQGHQQAYAATNSPLGVVTLYGPFFTVAADDTERAEYDQREHAGHPEQPAHDGARRTAPRFRRLGVANRGVAEA